jgi:hypothetical protein
VAVAVGEGVAVAVAVGTNAGHTTPSPATSVTRPSISRPEKVRPKLRTVCDTCAWLPVDDPRRIIPQSGGLC